MRCLKSFSIHRSLFTNRKIESLMRGLSDCSRLEKLELSFCQLTSTKAIGEFLSVNNTLSALELRGNYLSGNEVADLADAINQYKGNLCYLGLAQNPLQSIGLQCILYSILDTEQVNDLDISGVTHDADDVPYIMNFVASHAMLRAINLTAIPLMETNGETLVTVLRGNYGILRMPHKSCGLSEEQEMNLRILLDRNNYYDADPILHNNEISPEVEKEVDSVMKQKMYDSFEVALIGIDWFTSFISPFQSSFAAGQRHARIFSGRWVEGRSRKFTVTLFIIFQPHKLDEIEFSFQFCGK